MYIDRSKLTMDKATVLCLSFIDDMVLNLARATDTGLAFEHLVSGDGFTKDKKNSPLVEEVGGLLKKLCLYTALTEYGMGKIPADKLTEMHRSKLKERGDVLLEAALSYVAKERKEKIEQRKEKENVSQGNESRKEN